MASCLSKRKPFAVYLDWKYTNKKMEKYMFAKKQCHVIKDKPGMVLMFRSRDDIESAVIDFESLRKGVLIDWDKFTSSLHVCTICHQDVLGTEIAASNGNGKFYCRDCFEWGLPTQRKDGFSSVLSVMHFFEENDEISVAEGTLAKALVDRHTECTSTGQARPWIRGAIRETCIVQVEDPHANGTYYCLPSQEAFARSCARPAEDKTDEEEEMHVVSLLQSASEGWMHREAVIASLKNNFDTMQTPFEREAVLKKRSKNKPVFVVINAFVQLVALSESRERAKLELDRYALQHNAKVEYDRQDSEK